MLFRHIKTYSCITLGYKIADPDLYSYHTYSLFDLALYFLKNEYREIMTTMKRVNPSML